MQFISAWLAFLFSLPLPSLVTGSQNWTNCKRQSTVAVYCSLNVRHKQKLEQRVRWTMFQYNYFLFDEVHILYTNDERNQWLMLIKMRLPEQHVRQLNKLSNCSYFVYCSYHSSNWKWNETKPIQLHFEFWFFAFFFSNFVNFLAVGIWVARRTIHIESGFVCWRLHTSHRLDEQIKRL